MKTLNHFEKITPILFSIFSVIFSLSIVKELHGAIEIYFLVVLVVFISAFLIYNEIVKVRELRKLFKKERYSKFLLTSTLIISITLSSIGIYFWVNKTHEVSNESLINKTTELNEIESKYNSIEYGKFTDTDEYVDLKTNIAYWKRKSAGSLDERTIIRNRIDKYQDLLTKNTAKHKANIELLIKKNDREKETEIATINTLYDVTSKNSNRNNNISMIFLVLILITEGLIIMLNRDLSVKLLTINEYKNTNKVKGYLMFRKILESVYFVARKNSTINIHHFKYSLINTSDGVTFKMDFNQLKNGYNTLCALGVIKITEHSDKAKATIMLDKKSALKKYDSYYKLVLD